MTGIILKYLPWILPPLIGAAIGYITNAIAIGMLFRPYTEKRLLRIRIPMTPGIIPKQRYELSESIGRLVSRELLTEDAVRTQITSDTFIKGLRSNINSFIHTLTETPIGKLIENLSFKNILAAENKSFVRSIVPDLINNFLASSGLRSLIDSFIDLGMRHLEQKTLNDIVRRIPDFPEKLIRFIFSGENKDRFIIFIRSMVERGIHDNFRLSSLLKPEHAEKAAGLIIKLYELIYPKVLEWLRQPDIKKELELRGRFLLEDILEKLNRVQRFLLSVGQYDRTLEENMGSIVDDVLKQLSEAGRDPDNKEKLLVMITSRLRSISQLSLGEIAAAWDGNLQDDMEKAARILLPFLFSPYFSEKIIGLFSGFIEEKGNVTVESVLFSWFGLHMEDLRKKISSFIIPSISGESKPALKNSYFFKKLLPELFNSFTSNGSSSVSEILNLDEELIEKVSEITTFQLLKIIDDKIPEILGSVDVRTLVVRKIDSLEIEKVEELILEVVKKQLRWINLFGALLGSLIGGVQLILNLYVR